MKNSLSKNTHNTQKLLNISVGMQSSKQKYILIKMII